jgi:hypothetical protein
MSEEILVGFAAKTKEEKIPNHGREFGFNVVVLMQGFVYVGQCYRDDVDNLLIMPEARNIRYWGTTAGLHQLVITGPTKDSKIDGAAHVRVPWHQVVSFHASNPKLWAKLK